VIVEAAQSGLDSLRNLRSVTADYLSESAISKPVSQNDSIYILVFSVLSIFMCCASTSFCVRQARDSNIQLNALAIRRRYQRNMQLYCLLKEKAHIEKQVGILKGFPNKEDSVVSGGTGNCEEEEAESSFVTSSSFSSNDTSSYDADTNSFEGSNSKQKAVAKRHCPP